MKGHDDAARTAVAEFALTNRTPSPIEVEGAFGGSSGAVSGHTPQYGQVQIGDDNSQTREFSRGAVRERVGYYKLARYQTRGKHWVVIEHFWKADETTASETERTQQWVLALDRNGGPLWFGERGFKHVWTVRLTKLLCVSLSRELYPATWAETLGQVHRGASNVEVVIDNT